jgi:hypothetical protein
MTTYINLTWIRAAADAWDIEALPGSVEGDR